MFNGYGNSIRRIMEQKDTIPGILGVTADLIQTEKQYETAIEVSILKEYWYFPAIESACWIVSTTKILPSKKSASFWNSGYKNYM